MEKKLLELLVAKFKGVPETTLQRIASKKAGSVTDESQLQSIADGIDHDQIVQSEVDARVTEANKKAIQNYEKKYKLKEGKPVDEPGNPDPNPEPGSQNPEDVQTAVQRALEKSLMPLQQKIDALEKERTVETVKEKTLSKLKEKKIPQSFIGSINVESEEDIDEFVEAEQKRYEQFVQEQVDNGRWVDKSEKSTSSSEIDAEIEEWADSKSNEKGE